MDQAAFLETILRYPDDDAPRRMYADWLEEQGEGEGDPRGTFIRLQCQLELLPTDDPRRRDLEDQADLLLRDHQARWLDMPSSPNVTCRFRRGFVDSLSLPGSKIPDAAMALVSSSPVRRLEFQAPFSDAALGKILAAARHVRALAFRNRQHWPPNFGPLLALPQLEKLEELDLASLGIDTPDVQRVVQSPVFPHLRRLSLADNRSFGDRALRMIAYATTAAALQHLDLSGTNLTAWGERDALSSRDVSDLRGLNLAAHTQRDMRPILAHGGTFPVLSRLERLDLSGHRLGADGLRVVLSQMSPALRHLALRNCHLEIAAVRILLDSNFHLESVDWSENRLEKEGIRLLAQAAPLLGLVELRFANAGLRDSGLETFLTENRLDRLRLLDVSNNAIGGPALQALAAQPQFANLRELRLAGNFVGPASIRALMQSPILTNLETLDLSNIALDAEGVRELIAGPNAARLRHLRLVKNRLQPADIMLLKNSLRLRTLEVDGNPGAADVDLSAEVSTSLAAALEKA